MSTEYYLAACMKQAQPRLNTLLRLMFAEARALGHPSQWLSSVIGLMRPLGYGERAIRTALFRLGEHGELAIERHGRRSVGRLSPTVAASLRAERQRIDTPPARSFGEAWIMLVNSGGLGASRYAEARKRLIALDYCQLAPNVLARPAHYRGAAAEAPEPGLAQFNVDGAQLAAAVRQPLSGQPDWDLDAAALQYRTFQQRFQPLRRLLDLPGAIDDEQAYQIRLLVSHGYQHCRRGDPLLPKELLPADWPAMAAYQTYMALLDGCAAQSRRHMLTVIVGSLPDHPIYERINQRRSIEREATVQ